MSDDGILTNGGTEWFLVEQVKLVVDIVKIRTMMAYIYGDGV